jgi:phosphohistidine phosphatase
MDLYVIRHADALPLGQAGVTEDEERPLSETGKAQSRALAVALRKLGVRLRLLLTSPAVRARQTAEEMAAVWGGEGPTLQVCDALTMGIRTRKLANAIGDLTGEPVGLVGHQPDLSQFAAWLIGSRKAQVDFAKGGVARIRCPEGPFKGGGMLTWLLTPEWAEAVAKPG